MDRWVEFVLIALSIFVAVGLITFGMYAYRNSADLGNKALDEFETVAADLVNNDIVSRDGMLCYGSEATNFIRKYAGKKLAIVVVEDPDIKYFNYQGTWDSTNMCFSAGTPLTQIDKTANATHVSNCRIKGEAYYVSPVNQYLQKVLYDATEEIKGIAFIKQ